MASGYPNSIRDSATDLLCGIKQAYFRFSAVVLICKLKKWDQIILKVPIYSMYNSIMVTGISIRNLLMKQVKSGFKGKK